MKQEKIDGLISKKKKELEELKRRISTHIDQFQKHQKEANQINQQIQIKIGELNSLSELQNEL